MMLMMMMQFDDADILGATTAHADYILIKYFVKLVGGWRVVT